MIQLADQYVRDLEAKLKTLEIELDEWKSGAMADTTGHMFRCAKVNGVWQCAKGCAQHELADKEICIVTLEQLVLQLDRVHDEALKRIKVLEDAIGGPILK